MTTQSSQALSINTTELVTALEPLIRRIVREELARIVAKEPKVFKLKPDSPLYADMEEILRRKAKGAVKMHTHAEVWK